MTLRKKLFNFFIWWAVISFSLWVGGTLFNMTVVVPMWSESPPQSVKEFFGETSFYKYMFNFFGPPWMVIRVLPVLIALILGWYSKLHRNYLLTTLIILILAIVYTLTYIYPINDILMAKAGADKSAEEIKTMVDKWLFNDKLRFAVMLVGYFFLLKAFRLPISKQKT
ncbi:MAG: anthrone oxygenase family protein [Segetibacter sp.]